MSGLIDDAPQGRDLLVWYDHDADPYQSPTEPNKLTDYAAWAEGGDFLDGKGWVIAKWHDRHFESENQYGDGFWMPAAWFAKHNGDYEFVCNAIAWQELPDDYVEPNPPPAAS